MTRCPNCKEGTIEIFKVDMNLDRSGLSVWFTCSDNLCLHNVILNLTTEDIIKIGKSHPPNADSFSTFCLSRYNKGDSNEKY